MGKLLLAVVILIIVGYFSNTPITVLGNMIGTAIGNILMFLLNLASGLIGKSNAVG